MGKVLKIVGGLLAVAVIAAVAFGAWVWTQKRAPDIPYATLEKRWGSPADRYVDLPGGYHLRYRDQGKADGPVLVLLHGFYVSLETWEPWAAELGKTHRVISLDLPGHGLTRAPAGWPKDGLTYSQVLEAFAKAKGLDRFALAGSSMGGAVAWDYALAHPERVKGLILVDAAGWPQPGDAAGTKQLAMMKNPMLRAFFRDIDRSQMARDGLRKAYADPARLTDREVARTLDYGRAPGHRDALIDLSLGVGRTGWATAERLAPIKAPTLILHGEKDALIPVSSARKFEAAIPGSMLIVYPGVGHIPQQEIAESSAKDVAAFLASLEPKKKAPPKKPAPTAEGTKDPNALIFY
jgi:pimeloyl-ACP methyl ester carboxylesterase